MVLSEQNGQKNPLRQDGFLNEQILRETERREPPGPEPDAALESILRDRRAGPDFLFRRLFLPEKAEKRRKTRRVASVFRLVIQR